jgi:hypothetical protein
MQHMPVGNARGDLPCGDDARHGSGHIDAQHHACDLSAIATVWHASHG